MIRLTRKQFKRAGRKQINKWLRAGFSIQVVTR